MTLRRDDPPESIPADPVELSGFVSGKGTRLELTVLGVHCAGCVARLQRMLEHVPGVAAAEVSLVHNRVRVQAGPGEKVARAAIVETIEVAGFYV